MLPAPLRIAVPFALIALLAPAARAQLDVEWVTFANDPTRLGPAATDVSNGTHEVDLASGDLDNDGFVDLVVARKQPFTTTGKRANLLLMNEAGVLVDRTAAFAAASDVPGDQGFLTPTNDRDVVLADLDQDGWLDAVTATDMSDADPKWLGHPRAYHNLGGAHGWLGLRHEGARIPQLVAFSTGLPQNPRFTTVAAGDLDGDACPELFFTDHDAGLEPASADLNDRLLVNDGGGYFVDESSARVAAAALWSSFAVDCAIVDLNGDGLADVVKDTVMLAPQYVAALYNQPANPGLFLDPDQFVIFHMFAPDHLDVADMNGDGRPDIVVADDFADRYRYNLGNDANGHVTWSASKTFQFLSGSDDGFAGNVEIADLDRDGWRDVLVCDVHDELAGFGRRLHVYHNPGGAIGSQITLREERELATGNQGAGWIGVEGMLAADQTGTFDVEAIDVDDDCAPDLVVSRSAGTFVWRNQSGASGWSGAGGGVAGTNGVPLLEGTGCLAPGSHATLSLTAGFPSANAWLVVGGSTLNQPLFGGIVVPFPDAVLVLPLDANGALSFGFDVPPAAPGTQFWVQYWMQDPGAPHGWSASDALQGTIP
jgi:hypothetical protein